jgi:peroxiredoxin
VAAVLRQKRYLQILILGAILAVSGYTVAVSLADGKDGPPKVGDTAPNFTLTGLDGLDHELKDYRGKTVMLNFWGTFCPPCVNEMPLLDRMHREHADDMIVVGVNLDEPVLTVRSFVERLGIEFPILLDDMTVQRMYGIFQYPTTIVIDPNGKIIDIKIGEFRSEGEISRYL